MDTEANAPSALSKRRTWWQWIRRSIILYLAVPYLAVTLIFATFQRHLLYRPTVAENLTVAAVGMTPDFGIDVELETADKITLNGWLIHSKNQKGTGVGKEPLLIYFPGNSLNRNERILDIREMASNGFDVLIFDYRGFGDSAGSPSETHLSSDALLVWRFAIDSLAYEESQITIFGESLGGAVALSLWDTAIPNPPRPAALILSSTFASMPKTVAWHYPWFPFQFLLIDRWPSIERIVNVKVPTIIFHGTEDQMVPVEHARLLSSQCHDSRFVPVSGAGHNEIPMRQLTEKLKAISATLATAKLTKP